MVASPEFDFTNKQWAKILASMRALDRSDGDQNRAAWARIQEMRAKNAAMPEGAGEGPNWLEIARADLLKAVNRYMSHVELERAPTARIAKWKKIVRHAVELRRAIRSLDDPRDRLIFQQIEEETKTRADEFLRNIRTAAGTMEDSLGNKRGSFHIDHKSENRVLYRELFRIWWRMGGKLRGELGYRQMHNEPRGPLILFMQAVMEPVLKKRVAPETIRTWINEEERLRAELRASLPPVREAATDTRCELLADLTATFRVAAATVPALQEEVTRFELVRSMEIRSIMEELHGGLKSVSYLKDSDLERIFDTLYVRMEPRIEALMQQLGFKK